jgi:predicted RNase H-like HicB family nuclease
MRCQRESKLMGPESIEIVLPEYAAVVQDEQLSDGTTVYVASHPDLPGCMAHGDSVSEAIGNLHEARALYLRVLKERGMEIPPARTASTLVVWQMIGVTSSGPEAAVPSAADQDVRSTVGVFSPLAPELQIA